MLVLRLLEFAFGALWALVNVSARLHDVRFPYLVRGSSNKKSLSVLKWIRID